MYYLYSRIILEGDFSADEESIATQEFDKGSEERYGNSTFCRIESSVHYIICCARLIITDLFL